MQNYLGMAPSTPSHRGMWDSNLSDEFYAATKEFNLYWEEIVELGRNSKPVSYGFLPAVKKLSSTGLLARISSRVNPATSWGNTSH
jgi:hypothetical protein